MVKVAILGVEGSGKTVLFSVMGDRYETSDRNGLFLTPLSYETYSYCKKGMAALRKGEWPSATTPDAYVELDWDLMEKGWAGKRSLARLSFLDFAGEVYRKAFGGERREDGTAAERNAVERLRLHVKEADVLIVLADLSKIINGDEGDARTIEMNWLTQAMLSFVYEEAAGKSVALAFTQADRYEETLRQCGGVRGALAKYLRVVDSNYGDRLSLFEVSAVDRTVPSPDDPAVFLPASDFGSRGLEELMKWLVGCIRPSRSWLTRLGFVFGLGLALWGLCLVVTGKEPDPGRYLVVDLSGGTNVVSCAILNWF